MKRLWLFGRFRRFNFSGFGGIDLLLLGGGFDLSLHLASMSNEFARRRKFSQLMAHHVFRNEHGQMDLAVVNAERKAYHLGSYRRGSGPRLDHRFVPDFKLASLLEELVIDINAFVCAS